MTAGERESYKSFADTTRQNVKAILEHGNETRKLLRQAEETIEQMQAQIRIQDEKINELRNLLSNIQAKVYSGGT